MPTEPSSKLLNKWLKRPEKITGPMRKPKPLDPSWLRTGFEGAVDTVLGALGVGPDTRMNRAGAMLGAMGPSMKLINRIPGRQIQPTMSEIDELISTMPRGLRQIPYKEPYPMGRYSEIPNIEQGIPTQNRLAMGLIPENSILDESGRMIGIRPSINPAYEAHVASSRNKFPMRKR